MDIDYPNPYNFQFPFGMQNMFGFNASPWSYGYSTPQRQSGFGEGMGQAFNVWNLQRQFQRQMRERQILNWAMGQLKQNPQDFSPFIALAQLMLGI